MSCNENCIKSHMYTPRMFGEKTGPAKISSYEIKLNNYFMVTDIPEDIVDGDAAHNIQSFLDNICAIEIPSSLMCNCNCQYCYITEKWMKNKVIKKDIIKKILDESNEKILSQSIPEIKYISAWGAEPFMNLPTLEEILVFCKENKMRFNTSTNGTILTEKAKELMDYMFKNNLADSIQISLDGPEYIQNKNRPMYNGENTFNKTMKFVEFMNQYRNEKRQGFSICSTIYLSDNVIQEYEDCIRFFGNPDNIIFNEIMPMRIENHRTYDNELSDLFVSVIKKTSEVFEELSCKYNTKYMDYYATQLYLDTSRKDGFPYCSAMNSQIAIDIDGNMYMCHGPITTTELKPYFCFGNLFEGKLNYKAIIASLDMIFGWTVHAGFCKKCPLIDKKYVGMLCKSCPPSDMSLNHCPYKFDYFRCKSYKESLKYWDKMYERWIKNDR